MNKSKKNDTRPIREKHRDILNQISKGNTQAMEIINTINMSHGSFHGRIKELEQDGLITKGKINNRLKGRSRLCLTITSLGMAYLTTLQNERKE